MNKIFKGRYQDGISSKFYSADLSFVDAGLQIYFTDENGLIHHLFWKINDIKIIHSSVSFLCLQNIAEKYFQQLEISDSFFIDEFNSTFIRKKGIRFFRLGNRNLISKIVIAFIVFIVISYFFLLPLAANVFAAFIPRDIEISVGKSLYENALQGEEIDEMKTENINLFFQKIKIENDYPVKITVVKGNIDNAYSLPGGGIVVYDKILKDMKNPDELDALLAHEYSHIYLKHVTKNVFRNLSGYVLLSLFFGDANGIGGFILRNAEGLRTLKYNRALEHEADENGLKILKENNINADGMCRLFNELKAEGEIEPAEILNSHPDLDSRIEFVKKFEKENLYPIIKNDSMEYYFNKIKNEE